MRYHYTIQTYDDLRQWATKFAEDANLHCLVIFGWPGSGKTDRLTRALEDKYVITIKGRLTAFQLFCKLKEYKDALFLFDDTRRILKDFECVNLLMALGEHKMPKVIQWNTSTLPMKAQQAADDADDNPNEVITRSRIVLIINRVDEENEDLEPLFSRSVCLRFAPSKEAVHAYVGEWFPRDVRSQDIYDYIGRNLAAIPIADVRDYTKAYTCYDMDWRELLHQSWSADEYLTTALAVVNDSTIPVGRAQVDAFVERCGGSRAQFFRLKNKLMPLTYKPVSKSHRLVIPVQPKTRSHGYRRVLKR